MIVEHIMQLALTLVELVIPATGDRSYQLLIVEPAALTRILLIQWSALFGTNNQMYTNVILGKTKADYVSLFGQLQISSFVMEPSQLGTE